MGDGSDICTLVVRAAAKMSQETIGRVGTPGCEGTAGRIPFYARGRILSATQIQAAVLLYATGLCAAVEIKRLSGKLWRAAQRTC